MKHRIVHLLQKYFLNPPIKILFAIGIVPPGYRKKLSLTSQRRRQLQAKFLETWRMEPGEQKLSRPASYLKAAYACTCLRRCLFPVVVLDQGGGAGNERRKIRAVSPLLDSLRCRVLGGRKTHMGKRQRADSLRVLPCPRPDCRRH